MKQVTVTFSIEDEDLEQFIEENGELDAWLFGIICQNYDFGFLTGVSVERIED
jgi:hypothetical protein